MDGRMYRETDGGVKWKHLAHRVRIQTLGGIRRPWPLTGVEDGCHRGSVEEGQRKQEAVTHTERKGAAGAAHSSTLALCARVCMCVRVCLCPLVKQVLFKGLLSNSTLNQPPCFLSRNVFFCLCQQANTSLSECDLASVCSCPYMVYLTYANERVSCQTRRR